ncbi:MAG: biotin--[acetyl-CoA-carboxylase] ligase [Myxococcales bacterium]|nr:biotin--[acetyl-CoA-carboxylase] ligase [Myxococcales bacterium]
MIGCKLRRLESCASTNDEAASWARDSRDPAPHGGVILAATQTAGRGRLGRVWHSPPGENLYFSCVLRPPLAPQRVPPLTLCAGLAVCEVVNSLGVAASIKWPNDVLVGGAKIAGVLTEMSTRSQSLDSVVVGVGLNVNAGKFPAELAATSLALERGADLEMPKVLGSLLYAMDQWYEKYLGEGVAGLVDAFNNHSVLSGERVCARVGQELVSGRVVSLGEDGSLIVESDDGTHHRIIAGEVDLVS